MSCIKNRLYNAKIENGLVKLQVNNFCLNHVNCPFGEIVYMKRNKKIFSCEWVMKIELQEKFRTVRVRETAGCSFVEIPVKMLSFSALKKLGFFEEDGGSVCCFEELENWIEYIVTGEK